MDLINEFGDDLIYNTIDACLYVTNNTTISNIEDLSISTDSILTNIPEIIIMMMISHNIYQPLLFMRIINIYYMN